MDIDMHKAGEVVGEIIRNVGHGFTSAAHRIMEAGVQNPTVTGGTGIGLTIIAVLQSAQSVMATIIALVTSLGGLFMAFVGVREAWRKWRSKDEAGKK